MQQEEKTGKVQSEQKIGGERRTDLPADFYIKLLNLPACKISGICDGCGRCEK